MEGIGYTEFMGPNVLDKLKYCGKEVRVYNMTKIINPQYAELDDHCIIYDYSFIDAQFSFKLGKYSEIAWFCCIEGASFVHIGDRCFLGPGSRILGSTYKYNGYYSVQHLPEGASEVDYKGVIIENDAYIGANSVVMPGVKIGEGAMVGANSLVNHNLKPWGIYFGNPVKLIGMREKPTEERRRIVETMDWTKHF